MALLLQFRPQSVYRFSTQKVLPDKRFRLQKTLDPMDDFEIDRERTSELPPLDAVSLTLVGPTFDTSMVEHLPGPVYAVNWPVKLDRQDVVYATTDYTILGAFLVNEMFPILFVAIDLISKKLKRRLPKTKHVIGGVHAILDANVLSHLPAIDFAVGRKGEFAMLALVNGKEPGTISGVVSRSGLRLINDGDAKVNKDIDALPFPKRDEFWRLTGEGFVTHQGSLGARVMETIK